MQKWKLERFSLWRTIKFSTQKWFVCHTNLFTIKSNTHQTYNDFLINYEPISRLLKRLNELELFSRFSMKSFRERKRVMSLLPNGLSVNYSRGQEICRGIYSSLTEQKRLLELQVSILEAKSSTNHSVISLLSTGWAKSDPGLKCSDKWKCSGMGGVNKSITTEWWK